MIVPTSLWFRICRWWRWNWIDLAMSLLVGAVCGLVLWGMFALVHIGDPDPYMQRNFPCREDEALMYAPQFGPDRVGCVNTDLLPD